MKDDSILFLGTSDAMPSVERSHASLLLRLAGQTILLDAGEPAARTMARECVDFGGLDAVAVSHLHPDHVGGLLQVIVAMWLEAKRSRDIPVYMPAEGIEVFHKLVHATYLFPEMIKFKVDFRPWRDGQPVTIGNVQVTPHKTTHLDSIRQIGGAKHGLACEPFLIEIAGNGKRVVYSGDMGSPRDLACALGRPLDLLVTECAHFSARPLFEMLRGRPIKRIAMTHLGRKLWADQAQLRPLAAQCGLDGDLVIARDGMRLNL
jgi:ribonuclease BN (tRNA processing enzyme)